MKLKIKVPRKRLAEALEFAEKRNKKEKKFGAMTYGDKRSGLEAHQIGIVAEVAIATLFGLDFDKRIFENKGDDGKDLVLPNIGVCSIKATTYKDNSYLRAEVEHHSDNIAVYIACYVNKKDITDVWIIGWEYGDVVGKLKPQKLGRFMPWNYIVQEKDLRSPEELIGLVNPSK